MGCTDDWAVVTFVDDNNSVAVLPAFWITDEDRTYWPPPKVKNSSLLARKGVEPGDDWPQYNIKILGKYDDYDIALRKCKAAEDTSDLSGIDNSIKRKRKPTKKAESPASSDMEDSDSSNNGSHMPTFPKIHKTKHINTTRANQKQITVSVAPDLHSSKQTSHNLKTRNTIEMPLHSVVSPHLGSDGWRTPQSSHSPGPSSTYKSDEEFKTKVLTKLNIIMARMTKIEEDLEKFQTTYTQIMNKENEEDVHLNIEGLEFLPLTNEQELQSLQQVVENRKNHVKLAKELGRIGGSNVSEITKRIMYRIISSELGQLYSWEGGKGKRKFSQSCLKDIVFDAVRSNARTRLACDDEVIVHIKKWLVKAKERVVNKQKRSGITV